jgi:hypothetical protein
MKTCTYLSPKKEFIYPAQNSSLILNNEQKYRTDSIDILSGNIE